MYKIIKISNYGRTEVSDELVADNISNLEEAETMFNALEDSTGSKGPCIRFRVRDKPPGFSWWYLTEAFEKLGDELEKGIEI